MILVPFLKSHPGTVDYKVPGYPSVKSIRVPLAVKNPGDFWWRVPVHFIVKGTRKSYYQEFPKGIRLFYSQGYPDDFLVKGTRALGEGHLQPRVPG